MSSDPPAKGPRRNIRIGKYEVLSHVATGGMGAVYKARDTEHDREVALKVLSPEMAAKPAMVERFRREARHAAKLRHENVVTLYEFGEANRTYFLAMEFIDGIDLHEYVNRKGPLDPDEALQIILQGCRALDHAYEQGVIHRDIKPSNFLICRQGERLVVKMTDLGLAREAGNDEFRVTRAGTTVGTLDYMAPEQARDSGLADIRSDLYSLGSTWYHLLAGHAPFPKGGLGERLNRILNEEPQDVRRFNPRVSGPMAVIVHRLLAKAPSQRYQTPAELLRDLEALARGEAPLSTDDLLEGLAKEEEAAPVAPAATPTRGVKKSRRTSDGRKTPPPSRSHTRADLAARKSTAVDLPSAAETLPPYFWHAVAGAALLLAVGLSIVLSLRRAHRGGPHAEEPTPVVLTTTPPIDVSPRPPSPKPRPDEKPDRLPPVVVPPKKPTWPVLYPPANPVDFAALRKEIEAPWATPPPAAPTVELVVGRLSSAGAGNTFRSLADACKAIPAGAIGVIELRDNGPFFDVPAVVADRSLVLRPGKGYRPLLVWDVQRTLDERRGRTRGQRTEEAGPLVFLDVKHGSLTLQDLHVALRWPEAPSEGAAVLRIEDGDLTVSGCTFSVAGKPRDGVTLARFTATPPSVSGGSKDGRRCRFSRSYVRGTGLSVLDLNAPAAHVLFDNCLLVGGDRPLLQVRAGTEPPTHLTAVRSTMICGKELLTLGPAKETDREPAFQWLGWDTLLSRKTRQVGGELLRLTSDVGTQQMGWRAINCLYAGWETLLAGKPSIAGSDVSAWRRRWGRIEGDVAIPEAWPTVSPPEPAETPSGTYGTADSLVAFAASTATDQPLGCDLDALPPVRDNWLSLTFDRFAIVAPAVPDDPGPPEIPAPADTLYHGERLDLNQIDLGAYLQNVQQTRRLAPWSYSTSPAAANASRRRSASRAAAWCSTSSRRPRSPPARRPRSPSG